TALTNGNYVVVSANYNSGNNFNNSSLGAVTWGNGATGTTGTVSAANSLVGSTNGDEVGTGAPIGGPINDVIALANGNYVVDSPNWNLGEGAVTWGDGIIGTTGTVSAANSLIGSNGGIGTPDDKVGIGNSNVDPGVTVLANGNYVVDS